MIHTRVFRKHYLITSLILIAFIAVSFFATRFVMDWMFAQAKRGQGPGPTVFFARLVERLNPQDRIKALEEIKGLDDSPMISLYLVDEKGEVIYPLQEKLRFSWLEAKKPQNEFEQIDVREGKRGPPNATIVKLPGTPTQYLVGQFQGGPGGMGPPPKMFLFLPIGFLIITVLLGAGLALYLMFRSMNEKIVIADSVLEGLKSGNLKARLPITGNDEISQLMIRFNKMADEIEILVERIRSTEQSRVRLLQELTHDLRTPIASLKNLLETVKYRRNELDPSVQEEFLDLSLYEVEYFERLVEDLLLLAQVSDPKYQTHSEQVSLNEILGEEADSATARHQGKSIELVTEFPDSTFAFRGDPHLLRRLFRNAIDNAFSFAKKEVHISLKLQSRSIVIQIGDDGPGFPKEVLQAFGERRVSRILDKNAQGRLSVGLGSVIMKTAVDVYGGRIIPSNKSTSDHVATGACLTIELPAATQKIA